MIFASPHTSVFPMPSLNNSKLQTSGGLSSGAHNANRFHTTNNIGLKRLIQQNVFGWFLRFHTLDADGWVCLIKQHLGRINAAPLLLHHCNHFRKFVLVSADFWPLSEGYIIEIQLAWLTLFLKPFFLPFLSFFIFTILAFSTLF